MSARRVPTCYVHVGTHKTGTTSLQMLLTRNERVLAEAGIHVPRAGQAWPPSGHHNIAWELNTDARFDPRQGTLAQLVEEIAAVQAPIACVSSEDFEYLHEKPDRLEHLAASLQSAGYDARIIIYLRPQAEYAESLYPTLLMHDLAADFGQFLNAILRDGLFAYRVWTFRFDYTALLEPFARVFGPERLIVRPYRSGAPVDALPRDFMEIVSAGAAGFSFDRLSPVGRLNDSGTVLEGLRAALRSDGSADTGSFHPIGLGTSLRMVRRFWRDNRRVRARYGVRVPCVEAHDLWHDVATAWRRDRRPEA